MKNVRLYFLLLALPLMLLYTGADAQTISSSSVKTESASVLRYKKVARSVERSKRAVKEAASMPGGKKQVQKSVRKRSKKKGANAVDSVRFSPEPYLLGERIIMPGDSGRDVRSVAQLLVNKLYIDEADLIYTSDGGVVYRGELVRAVKHFQEFNGFYVDGIIGRDLIKALRKKIER